MNIVFGGDDAFNALLYRNNKQNEQHQMFLANQIENLKNTGIVFNDPNFNFMQKAQEMYNRIYSSDAMRIAKAALAQVGHIFQEDNIRTLADMTSMQNAPMTMQRWIMANPMVREKYHAQQCDGYSETYQDVFPGLLRDDHYDYRRVMNHVISEDEKHGWSVKHYIEDIYDGDRELELYEKTHILNTWDIIEGFMKQGGSDPTSVWNTKL